MQQEARSATSLDELRHNKAKRWEIGEIRDGGINVIKKIITNFYILTTELVSFFAT